MEKKQIITLWGSNKLCAYYNLRKCEQYEVVPPRIDILNYLVPMWHVCSNKFQNCFNALCLYIGILLEREFLGAVFPLKSALVYII